MTERTCSSILTIDDDDAVRQSIKIFLEDCEFQVYEAENGRIGVDVFRQHRPDIVLVDLRMPEMDGLEVLSTINKESPRTPVIVVSGTGVVADAIEALRLGAWDYVLKPIEDMEVLHHSVRKSLDQVRLRRQNEEYQRDLEESLRRISEDEEAGRRVQMQLLPPEDCHLGHYQLTRHFVPSMHLSGDFVDYFNIDSNHVCFYAADVSGHGVSSALVTVLLKSFVRKQLEKLEQRTDEIVLHPSKMLEGLNAELCDEDLGKHLTIFYAVLNDADNTLVFANGGQFPPPIIWTSEGFELIHSKGMAVGLFPDAQYTECVRQLPDDFRLSLFSDGVLDVLPRQSLKEKLDYLCMLGDNELLGGLACDLESRLPLPDDVTILTISRGISNERWQHSLCSKGSSLFHQDDWRDSAHDKPRI